MACDCLYSNSNALSNHLLLFLFFLSCLNADRLDFGFGCTVQSGIEQWPSVVLFNWTSPDGTASHIFMHHKQHACTNWLVEQKRVHGLLGDRFELRIFSKAESGMC